MSIFWRLVLAHLLADFTLQTDRIARWKRQSFVGGLVHSLVFLVLGGLLLIPELGASWRYPSVGAAVPGWAVLLALSALHFLEDEWRVRTIVRRGAPDSFVFFLLDQFIHLALIFLLTPHGASFSARPWVLAAILFVVATHFASIFVYFLEKDLFGSADLSVDKYYSMVERLITALVMIIPGSLALVVAVPWLFTLFLRGGIHAGTVSLFSVVAGNLLAAAAGLLARSVLY